MFLTILKIYRFKFIILFLLALGIIRTEYAFANGSQKDVVMVIDAEFGLPNSTSAQSISLGAQLAIADIAASGLLKDVNLKIEQTDNRGVPAIGVDNLSQAAARKEVLAVMGGKFSPVYIEQRPVADRLGIILLDPWGSADGITQMGAGANWAFRLSLTDQWAAPAFVEEAKKRSAHRIGVIIPNTAWGRSNSVALKQAAAQRNVNIVGEAVYNWGDKSLMPQYDSMVKANADLVILVANENEGALIVREIANLPKERRLPILSHWGITGGNFSAMTNGLISNVDLAVIQTFSFYNPLNKRAQNLLPRVLDETNSADISTIKSAVGIAQAYDLTWLFALAIAKANSTERNDVRDALESIDRFDGAIKSYQQPFSKESHNAPLDDQLFFAVYSEGNEPKPRN